MDIKVSKLAQTKAIVLLSFFLVASVEAETKIIKEEKLSFERCIDVINTSESKLSVVPKIIEESDVKRSAVFDLIDGTLTILCDGEKGLVRVSTSAD